jgi:hypothetical protein
LISFLSVEIEYVQICLGHNVRSQKKYPKKDSNIKMLQWTADKINLVELIYALSFANCINNGNVKIKHIMEAFEKVFSIDLGEYYRAYVEVKRRKIIRGKFMRILLGLLEENITESDKK